MGTEKSYFVNYPDYLLINIFIKDMSQSNPKGNKKKPIRLYKIK